jgi:hypothetical protein
MKGKKEVGTLEVLVFFAALISGTVCSLSSKTLMDTNAIGITGEMESFSKPLFQTMVMFLGMCMGLVMHHVVVVFKLNFPGYNFDNPVTSSSSIPTELYYYLLIPSMFDLCCSALSMYGLTFVNVSVYQMLRGGAIVFVALLKVM